jgi:hypothetical protein
MSAMISYPVAQRIWGSTDCLFLFFAGGAAEFAAIKAVDWLFFTNTLPSAPIERFFETVQFAQQVFFSNDKGAAATIDAINRIHGHVEHKRGREIPQWAYADVLFILIDYGERAHTIVFGPMTEQEKVAYFEACLGIGKAMHLKDLPDTYAQYLIQRKQHLLHDYAYTPLTDELFACYRRDLGAWRYFLLRLIQASLVPEELRSVLRMKPIWLINKLLKLYRFLPGAGNKLWFLQPIILPYRFAKQLRKLEKKPVYQVPGKSTFKV